jgi:cyclopropane-fatty-acyl-phospholipid synthase
VQSITIGERHFPRYRSSTDFIQQYIFPGGMLPSVERFERSAARAGLHSEGHYAFGRDYAETLRRWRSALHAARAQVVAQGFDAHFMRIWTCISPTAKPLSTRGPYRCGPVPSA